MTIQTVTKLTPAEAAAFTLRLTGGHADPVAVGRRYLNDAAEWRDMALKALASPSGKFRGATAAELNAVANDLEARATSVPAELRKQMA